MLARTGIGAKGSTLSSGNADLIMGSYVVLEGSHGVGKTTLIEQIGASDVEVIGRYLLPEAQLSSLRLPVGHRYLLNEYAKSLHASTCQARCILQDRSYGFGMAMLEYRYRHRLIGSRERRSHLDLVEASVESGVLLRPNSLVALVARSTDLLLERVRRRDGAPEARGTRSESVISFLNDFFGDPPVWYRQLVAEDYVILTPTTIEADTKTVREILGVEF